MCVLVIVYFLCIPKYCKIIIETVSSSYVCYDYFLCVLLLV